MGNRRRREPNEHHSKAHARMDRHGAMSFLHNQVEKANLKSTPNQNEEGIPDHEFRTNADFWNSILRGARVSLRVVKLIEFQIVDWFPRTPGLYFTRDAEENRFRARRYEQNEGGILHYSPRGKSQMVLGGLGAVRFKPIAINNEEYWLGCATSDGKCHTGIPLAIPDGIMAKLDRRLNAVWSISGKVKFLPGFLEEHFYHSYSIPQIYVQVEEVEDLSNIRSGRFFRPVEVSPIVYFSGQHEGDRRRNEGNVAYVRCRADSLHELSLATEWLDWYVDKYDGTIVTNFDQQRPAFKEVPFSLQNVMEGKLKESDLQKYNFHNPTLICEKVKTLNVENLDMSNSEINTGDQYNVGQAGAVGRGAKAENITFNQIQMNRQNGVDIHELSSELSQLRGELLNNAKEPEHYVEIGAVAEAEAEAKQGNKSKSFEALTKVGKWTLDMATTIGTRVAAEAIKISLGM